MKSVSKWSARRNGAYRPQVECLESRMQPGSMLLSGAALSLLDSSLDTTALPPSGTTSDDSALTALRLTDTNNLALGVTTASAPAGTISAAPVQGTSLTPAVTTPLADLSTTAAAPAPVIPVASTLANPTPVAAGGTVTSAPPSSSNIASLNHMALPSVQVQPVLGAVTAQATPLPLSLHPVTNLRVSAIQTHSSGNTGDGGGIQPLFTPGFETYVGSSVGNDLTKIKFANLPGEGNRLVVAGSVTDTIIPDATAQDLLLVKMNTDGTLDDNGGTQPAILAINFDGGGTGVQFFSRALEVGPDGTIYVGGFVAPYPSAPINSTGLTNGLLLSISPNFSNPTINWAFTTADPTIRSQVLGMHLNSSGSDLYMTGDLDGSSMGGPLHNIIVADLYQLNMSMPNAHYFLAYTLADQQRNALPSFGTDMAPDSQGNADLTGKVTNVDGTTSPFFFRLDTRGRVALPGVYSFNTTDANSIGLAITVDSSRNYYVTGGLTDANISGVDSAGELIVRVPASNLNPSALFYSDPSGIVDLYGTGIHLAGGSTNLYISETFKDTSMPRNSATRLGADVTEYSNNGQNIIDSTNGALSGSRNDAALGLDVSSSIVSTTIYAVGSTDSRDLPTTPGVYQMSYQGGEANGFVAGFRLQ